MRLVELPTEGGYAKARALVRSTIRRRPLGTHEMADALAPLVRQELLDFDPDIVHVTMGRLATLGVMLDDRPSVLAALDAWHLTRQAQADMERGAKRALMRRQVAYVRRFEASEYRRYDRVVVVSDEDRGALELLDPSTQITVISNGVDIPTEPIVGGPPPDPGRIMFHGVMSFAPNEMAADFLARRVLPRVRAWHPKASLAIVGREPSARVKALAHLEGVMVAGEVSDVKPWLSGSRVYACGMVSGTGIKNKLLEAMACRTACVATPLALQGLRAQPGLEVLVGVDAEQFAGQVSRVISDDELAARLGQAGRDYVRRNHSWDAVAAAYERLYLEVCSARAAG
jgi:glycosyltransferase involved in cell wall biosynthesis